MADQRMADQRMADQRMADQRMADQRIADQRMADQRMADQRIADQTWPSKVLSILIKTVLSFLILLAKLFKENIIKINRNNFYKKSNQVIFQENSFFFLLYQILQILLY